MLKYVDVNCWYERGNDIKIKIIDEEKSQIGKSRHVCRWNE